jgi:uncharacterized membrane protein YfcA
MVAVLSAVPQGADPFANVSLSMWVCIAPAQAAAAWVGAQLVQRVAEEHLSRIFAVALAATGAIMLHSSFA